MEEIINSVMQSPENTNPNVLRGQLQKMGGSGGGVLIVTDTDGTLDKTMGEIQDAYFAGKRVIISGIDIEGDAHDVIGMYPVRFAKFNYRGMITTFWPEIIVVEETTRPVLVPYDYIVSGETEEAARNAYPVFHDPK